MAEGFRFNRPADSMKELAQNAADQERILLPLHCKCGKEVLVNVQAFRDPAIFLDTLKDEIGWGVITTYIPQIKHVAIRPVCPACLKNPQEE